MKIGFFDSGLGGLIILKAVAKALPEYDYEYFVDTKNLPLGDKTESEILSLTKVGIEHLFERGCILVIIACNTASSETLRTLQDTFIFKKHPNKRILGVIVPTVESIFEHKLKNVLLLATKRTVKSGKYKKELSKQSIIQPRMQEVAVPELVPLIEAGKLDEALRVAKLVIKKSNMEVGEIDGIILGCTHYTLLKNELREAYMDKHIILSQDEIIPAKLEKYLSNHPEIETKLTRGGKRNIFLTEHRGDYDKVAAELLDGGFIKDQYI